MQPERETSETGKAPALRMAEHSIPTSIAAGPLTPREVRRALRASLVAWGLFGSAWMALASGAVYVTFVREKLHASTFMYAVIMSLPYFACLAQLWGSHLTETRRRRRRQCLLTLTGSRSLWLFVAALPWIVPAAWPELRVGLLLALMLLSNTLSHLSNPAGFSWFADVVPEKIRARYLAERAAVSTATVVIVSTYASWLIDHHKSFTTFTIIFAVAGVLGLADIWLYALLVREPPMAPHEGPPWRISHVLATPWRNRPFRRYLLYVFSEAFMNGLVGPFWWLMALEFLKIGAFWSNMYVMVIPMLACAAGLYFIWRKAVDRMPTRTLASIGTLAGLAYPILWVMATHHTFHWFLGLSAIIGGGCWAATQTADMSMMYTLTPQKNRSAFMACLMIAANLGLAISQLVGGRIAQALESVSFPVGSLRFGNIHCLMLISIVVILAHAFFVIPRLPTSVAESEEITEVKVEERV